MAEGRNRQIISQDNPLLAAAAAEELLHNDDTTMRVQSLKKEKAGSERTGIITTSIVSKVAVHQVALFFAGGNHVGDNQILLMDEPHDIANARSRFLLIGKVKSTTLICLS